MSLQPADLALMLRVAKSSIEHHLETDAPLFGEPSDWVSGVLTRPGGRVFVSLTRDGQNIGCRSYHSVTLFDSCRIAACHSAFKDARFTKLSLLTPDIAGKVYVLDDAGARSLTSTDLAEQLAFMSSDLTTSVTATVNGKSAIFLPDVHAEVKGTEAYLHKLYIKGKLPNGPLTLTLTPTVSSQRALFQDVETLL